MQWMIIGIVLVVLFLTALFFFFSESKAVTIADEEMEDIEKKDPDELFDELVEVEKENLEELKKEENDSSYSHS